MTLYYCKTQEQWVNIIQLDELYQGTTTDEENTPFVNDSIFQAKAHTSQSELEQILASKFNIGLLRASNSEYLIYCHSIILWYHLELQGKIRDTIKEKYEGVIKRLEKLANVIAEDGSIINPTIDPVDPTPNTRRSKVGQRRLDPLCPVYRVPDQEIPVRPNIIITSGMIRRCP